MSRRRRRRFVFVFNHRCLADVTVDGIAGIYTTCIARLGRYPRDLYT